MIFISYVRLCAMTAPHFSATIYCLCVWHETNGTRHTLAACKLRPFLLHSCWEDGEMINSSNIPRSSVPPPSLPSSLIFHTSSEKQGKSQRGALSVLCCRVSRPPRGLLVWTFKIRICNDTEQSSEDAVITEQRTSDQGEEGPDQTHPLGSDDEPQTETSKLIHKARLHVRRLLSHTLSKFVTSVYHLHPSGVNKHVICAAFPGPPTHPFHWQYREKN